MYKTKYDEIITEINEIAKKNKKAPPKILAVTKKQNTEKICDFIKETNHIDFAENYIQEANEKYEYIKKEFPNIKLHFIGHLQSNKLKQAIKLCDVISSIDSYKLAEKADKIEKSLSIKRQYLLQVNIGEEEQKFGIRVNELPEILKKINTNLNISINGLMAVPPAAENPTIYFAFLKKLADENKLNYLSMGMSSDYKEAIMVGSDEVRIGTAFFGKRI